MNLVEILKPDAVNDSKKMMAGKWRSLKLVLDRIAGEQINIGVIYYPEDGLPVWRLLSNTTGLRKIYGQKGATDAAFAISQANEILARGHQIPDGWSIVCGPLLYASGNSSSQILDGLYSRLVSLSSYEDSAQDGIEGDMEDHRLGTIKLRKRVRGVIKSRFGKREMPAFWKDAPFWASTKDGHSVSLDLQVWVESGITSGVMAGVTSAWYTTKFHRDSSLNSSYRSLNEAREVMGSEKAKASLFILRPMSDDSFTGEQLRTIDNEIDGLHWLLAKRKVAVSTFGDEQSLAEAVLAIT